MPRFDSWKAVIVSSLFWFVATASSPAETFTTLYSFCSQANCGDGEGPNAGLSRGTDGNLYGTTVAGGSKHNGGTVFKVTTGGMLTTLYSFCAEPGVPPCWKGSVANNPRNLG
jgi:uncharacterized repeat protein (TIGR03803 family)